MPVRFHRLFLVLFCVFLSGDFIVYLQAQSPAAAPVTLFRNVRVLSKEGQLSSPSNVLVRGNVIERISISPIPTDRSANTKVIEGNGRTLMPGLIDAHTHIVMQSIPMSVAMIADIGYLNLVAGKAANDMLLRGFTTIRDLGGPSFGLKMAIDQGLIPGPRIYPSGAFISQTSGHGDFRMPYEIPRTIGGPLSHAEQMGVAAIADGPDEVRLRARNS
jgi:imidazolonepropionase-like amidohydrolase